MSRHILAGAVPPNWSERLKGAQFGFIAGLLVGLLFGWFFHGVISLAVRFGLLLILLLPLLVIGWLWLRSQRPPAPAPSQSSMPAAPGQGWTAVIDRRPSRGSSQPEPPDLIDVPYERPARPAPRASTSPPPDAPRYPTDVEAELEALQRERDQRRERGA